MCTFTAPKAGYYLFYGHVQFVDTGENGSRSVSISASHDFGIQYSEVPGAKDCWPVCNMVWVQHLPQNGTINLLARQYGGITTYENKYALLAVSL